MSAYVEPLDGTDELYLVVNADDFGRSDGVNRGILRAHERGIVTSTSLMVRWPAAEQGARALAAYPRLGVGLHVDLCEWAFRDGEWRCGYEVVPLDDRTVVADEVVRQVERFRTLIGREPSHLDTHQHVHRREVVAGVLLEIAHRLALPLRELTPAVRHCGAFYGQTSKGDPYPEGITVDALIAHLRQLGPGVTEIGCHPADGEVDDPTYVEERATELATLCHPDVRDAILELGIELRSFADVRQGLRLDARSWEEHLRKAGIAAVKARDVSAARWLLGNAVALRPESASAWVWLSKAEHAAGDAAAALRAAEQARELEPTWPSVELQVADALVASGRRSDGIAVLQALVSGCDDLRILRRALRRLTQLRDEGAAEAAERVLSLAPGDEEASYARASALWRSGDPAGAVALLEEGRGRRPAATRAAARLFLDLGEPLRAWAAIESLAPEEVTRPLLVAAGNELRKAGALSASLELFERALTLDGADSTARHSRDVVAGEAVVLRDGWSGPPLRRPRRFRPVRGRVLHVVGHSAPHRQVGYTVRSHYIACAQRDAGLEPHIVTRLGFPWDDGVAAAAAVDEMEGVPYHRLRSDQATPACLGERLDETVRRAAALVRDLRPAVLHAATDYRNALVALALGRAFRLPVVYEVRGFWEETRLPAQGPGAVGRESYRWHRLRELDCMRSADAVVTLADVMKEELVARGVDEHAISVVPNAVDSDAFRPTERDRELAASHGFGENEVVLGYVSSLSAYEGVGFLLEAVARLVEQRQPVRCLVVGDGEQRAALEMKARALGLGDRAVFTGRVPHADVLRYYSLIDVFVVPRTADRVSRLVTPLKPYEAMAAGRAVVVSSVPALREMVADGTTGLLFRPEDPDDLVRVVTPLVVEPARRQALGRAAREWVSRERTWRANGRKYLDLYRKLGAA